MYPKTKTLMLPRSLLPGGATLCVLHMTSSVALVDLAALTWHTSCAAAAGGSCKEH